MAIAKRKYGVDGPNPNAAEPPATRPNGQQHRGLMDEVPNHKLDRRHGNQINKL